MKLAVMQPYLFPYIGYFQLMNAVDKFIVLEDVNFINKGWINRNRILVNGSEYLFTVPLKNASQNTLIKELELAVDEKWKSKFLKTIELAYKKSSFFYKTFELVKQVVDTKTRFLRDWYYKSFELISCFLGIGLSLKSSMTYNNRNLKGQKRIIDICRQEKADHYINPIGGQDLYDRQLFNSQKIRLNFLKSDPFSYKQFNGEFVPWLSIIDVMMFNDKQTIQQYLKMYELV